MNWEALVIALVPSLTIGVLTYRLSRKKDAVSEQSGVASDHRAGTTQVLEGLNKLVDQLQEDNTTFRADLKDLAARLKEVTAERDAFRLELVTLQRRYGVNGEATAPKVT